MTQHGSWADRGRTTRATAARKAGPAALAAIGGVVLLAGVLAGAPGPDRAAAGGPNGPCFANVGAAWGVADLHTFRAHAVDLDGDGWPDLVLQKLGDPHDRKSVVVLMNRRDPRHADDRVFVDATAESNLLCNRRADDSGRMVSALVFADVNNDGFVDCFSGAYCNFRQWKIDEKTHEPALDADGKPVFTEADHGDRNEILLNDGRGHFTLVKDSGVNLEPATTCAAAFVDIDNDGCVDLFVGNWYSNYGNTIDCYPNRLYRGRGDGTFEDVSEKSGILPHGPPGARDGPRPTYGVSHTDWNNDGRQDILVCAYGRQWNQLWRNNGDGTFTDVARETAFDGDEDRSGKYPPAAGRPDEPPYRANGNTFDAAVCDFDGDGNLDVFLSEITHWWAGPSSDRSCLLVNSGPKGAKVPTAGDGDVHPYAFVRDTKRGIDRVHAAPDWNQGDLFSGWLDVDNDGLPDLLVGSSDYPDEQILRLFRQTPDHRFVDSTDRLGLTWRSPTLFSIADFDRDGAADLIVGNNHMRLTEEQQKALPLTTAILRNQVGGENHWLNLLLSGRGRGGANVSAIGARVTVSCGGVRQTREVYGGQGHAGHQDAFDLRFGLGAATKVDLLEVRWPNAAGSIEKFTNVKANRFLRLTEGEGKLRE